MKRWQLSLISSTPTRLKAGARGPVAATLYNGSLPLHCVFDPGTAACGTRFHGHIFHSYYSPLKTRLFILIERLLARFCTDQIIVVSEHSAARFAKPIRVGRPEHSELSVGVDLEEFAGSDGEFREDLGIAPDELTVGIVGRLVRLKKSRDVVGRCRAHGEASGEPARPVHSSSSATVHLRGDLSSSPPAGIVREMMFAGFREARDTNSGIGPVVLTSLNEGTPLTLIEASFVVGLSPHGGWRGCRCDGPAPGDPRRFTVWITG